MPGTLLAVVSSCLRDGQGLLVALSGGADSVALLHLLLTLKDARSLRIEAAHVEHGIRGEESKQDLRFVRELCQQWNVPLHVRCVDAPAHARRTGQNLEQAARELRYAFLEETRAQRGLDKIVLAHHLDDQAETVLLHLIRGSALRGLTGMQAESGRLLRPLLTVSREELRAYLNQNGLSFREDSSNRDVHYSRNRLRLEVMPLLKGINPDAAQSIARCAQSLREDEDYLDAQAQELFLQSLQSDGLHLSKDAPRPLRLRVLRKYLQSLGEGDVDRVKLVSLEELLFLPSGTRRSVGSRLFVRDSGSIRPVEEDSPFAVLLDGPGEFLLPDGARLRVSFKQVKKDVRGTPCAQLFRLKETDFPLLARSFRPGDRMQPFGMNGSKLLSDLFTDGHISSYERARLPVIEKDGRILFVPTVRRSALYAVEKEDAMVLEIAYMRAPQVETNT